LVLNVTGSVKGMLHTPFFAFLHLFSPFSIFFYLFLPYFTLRKQRFKRYPKKATQNTNIKERKRTTITTKPTKQKQTIHN
jgi:hypothetical protein